MRRGASVNVVGLIGKDENEAIDTRNIIDERTRGATKKAGTYRELGDKEGLPRRGETGSSALRTEGRFNV